MTGFVVLLVSLVGATVLAMPSGAQPANDDQHLRDIQQRLARAWRERDRAYIESVLASEWSVTQSDGQVLSRATVLSTFFDAVTFDDNVIDDVTVLVFGEAAVVRGRTVASGKFNGVPFNARIRFTDVFIKRTGRWQAVASHASSLQAAAGAMQGAPRQAQFGPRDGERANRAASPRGREHKKS